MSMVGHDLRRERIAGSSAGRRQHLVQHAVHPNRIRKTFSYDSKWMSEAPFWIASTSTMFTRLDDRRLVGRLLQLEDVDLGAFFAFLDDLDVREVGLHVHRTLVIASVLES